jgi:hypothetical protein
MVQTSSGVAHQRHVLWHNHSGAHCSNAWCRCAPSHLARARRRRSMSSGRTWRNRLHRRWPHSPHRLGRVCRRPRRHRLDIAPPRCQTVDSLHRRSGGSTSGRALDQPCRERSRLCTDRVELRFVPHRHSAAIAVVRTAVITSAANAPSGQRGATIQRRLRDVALADSCRMTGIVDTAEQPRICSAELMP